MEPLYLHVDMVYAYKRRTSRNSKMKWFPLCLLVYLGGVSGKGYTQRDQLRVMREFREGAYNTLVSTCVGEEGLDIGQVDLIVCFDSHKSPIRMIQRFGRTGRRRQGRIVVLLTEGWSICSLNVCILIL